MKNKAKIPRKLLSKVHIYITLLLECTQIKKKKKRTPIERKNLGHWRNKQPYFYNGWKHICKKKHVLDHIRGGYVIQKKIYLLDVMRDDWDPYNIPQPGKGVLCHAWRRVNFHSIKKSGKAKLKRKLCVLMFKFSLMGGVPGEGVE